jgi:hypothetical protein
MFAHGLRTSIFKEDEIVEYGAIKCWGSSVNPVPSRNDGRF